MVVQVRTIAFSGIDVIDIDAQVQIRSGISNFVVVGLPDKAVAESRERVQAALHAMGLALPPKRIVVNLAPADVQKEGSHYDLPIALGVLAAIGVLPEDSLAQYIAMGELSLDGTLRAVSGVLPAAVYAGTQGRGIICPQSCGPEAVWAGAEVEVLAPQGLHDIINHIKGRQVLNRPAAQTANPTAGRLDLSDVRGQETARRALEIAAAGGHNMIMSGPPGAGKSMLAARLPSILPPLTAKEALEVSMIHSIAGELEGGHLMTQRPFRDPHHSASLVALVGGGRRVKPGEISLAHHGILFLDELPEFSRQTLDSLRQPIETGRALIARANQHVTFPARFQLIAAMNPCRCGNLDDAASCCARAPKCAADYQNKISGPILDRIDIFIDVPRVNARDLIATPTKAPESSAIVARRVLAARERQITRQGVINAQLPVKDLSEIAMDGKAKRILAHAAETMVLSARGYHRCLRLAQTIADLDEAATIEQRHISEALSYRRQHAA